MQAARTICRMVGLYGAGDLSSRTTPEFAAAAFALSAACLAFEALDDQPGEHDNTGTIRVGEDGPPAG
jgi:hypothetical protein